MEQKTDYTLDMLTSDSVSVLRRNYIEFGSQKYFLNNTRNAYMNSPSGRTQIENVLPTEYFNAVINVWGDSPTISNPMEESEE